MPHAARALPLGLLALVALAAEGCAEGAAPGPPEPFETGSSPAYDAVWQAATHNSYWVDRGAPGDAFASGTSERLLDQLLVDHARALELDVHRDDDAPHAFRVYHTVPGNSLCDTLPECLGVLRAFHRTVPQHEVVHVVLELKEIFAGNFDADHTVEDLDGILEDELGGLLFGPRDVLSRCPGIGALSTCVAQIGWPSIASLRGRFVFSVLGNWDDLGGRGTADWVSYATAGDPRERAAFPMASSWKLDFDALPPLAQAVVTQAGLDAALAQSAVLQIEDLDDARAPEILSRRGLVRVDNAFGDADQAVAVAAGFQLLQTDTPWAQHDDRGLAEPFRAFSASVSRAETTEPGDRLALSEPEAGELVFAYSEEQGSSSVEWQTTASFGAGPPRLACLRAASALSGQEESSASLCARKVSGRPSDLGNAAGTEDAERLYASFVACRAGQCETTEIGSSTGSPAGPGELLSLSIEPAPGGGSCAAARSARTAGRDLEPVWTPVGERACFATKLVYQGISRLAPAASSGPAYYFGTTRARGGEGARPVSRGGLSVVVSTPGGGAEQGRASAALLLDLSTP